MWERKFGLRACARGPGRAGGMGEGRVKSTRPRVVWIEFHSINCVQQSALKGEWDGSHHMHPTSTTCPKACSGEPLLQWGHWVIEQAECVVCQLATLGPDSARVYWRRLQCSDLNPLTKKGWNRHTSCFVRGEPRILWTGEILTSRQAPVKVASQPLVLIMSC